MIVSLSAFVSLKKLVVKRPVQPVSAIPANQASNPEDQKDSKRKPSTAIKSPGECTW